MSVPRIFVGAVLLSIALNSPANATPIPPFSATATASVSAGFLQDFETDSVANGRSAGPVSAALPGGFASSSVTEIIDPNGFGHTVELDAFATTNSTPVGASGHSEFHDSGLIWSNSLAAGTPVEFFAELDASWTVTPNGVVGACFGKAIASAGLDWQTNNQHTGNINGALLVQDSNCDAQDINNPSGIIRGFVGDELIIVFFVTASANGIGATADVSSLRLLLTPQGDFSYNAASGNVYANIIPAAEVPEPTTMLLLGSGVAFLARRARRRAENI